MTSEELNQIKIQEPSKEIYRQIRSEWDHMAKPLDGMGRFEELTAQIGAILENVYPDISRKAVIVMCADNGIVEEGVSQSGQEVTLAVSSFMGKNQTSVGKMATRIGADVIPVDIGINHGAQIEGVIDRKIAHGTKNFRKEPAMTESETLAAIQTGIEMAAYCKREGYQLLATGEMGIGNTTTSSAVAAALTGLPVEEITGRGAGLSDEGLRRKRNVIIEALKKYDLRKEETLRILMSVGGLDIAGLTGVFIGGAMYHLPVVLDGVISAVAALAAERLKPGTRAYMIPSHKSKEPAAKQILDELCLSPVIDASLALGEGTGAVMMFALLDMALSLYQRQTTFSDIHVEQYRRYTKTQETKETGEKSW